jgi:hypothetical protein
MTDMTPTPQFRAACREILGGDDPATVLGAAHRGDRRWRVVRALHERLFGKTEEECQAIIEDRRKQHEAVREAIRQGIRKGLSRHEIEAQAVEDRVGCDFDISEETTDWIAVLTELGEWEDVDVEEALWLAREQQITTIVNGLEFGQFLDQVDRQAEAEETEERQS